MPDRKVGQAAASPTRVTRLATTLGNRTMVMVSTKTKLLVSMAEKNARTSG